MKNKTPPEHKRCCWQCVRGVPNKNAERCKRRATYCYEVEDGHKRRLYNPFCAKHEKVIRDALSK